MSRCHSSQEVHFRESVDNVRAFRNKANGLDSGEEDFGEVILISLFTFFVDGMFGFIQTFDVFSLIVTVYC